MHIYIFIINYFPNRGVAGRKSYESKNLQTMFLQFLTATVSLSSHNIYTYINLYYIKKTFVQISFTILLNKIFFLYNLL